MKKLLLIPFLTFIVCFRAFSADYVLSIDGKTYEIDLNDNKPIKISKNQTINVMIQQKKELTFKSERFFFKYPKRIHPERTYLGHMSAYQTVVSSKYGTSIIIQEHSRPIEFKVIETAMDQLFTEFIKKGLKVEK
ncbi:MAG: hypothetical protein GY786_15925, partial [Proteobacteria bacterium]|nr:hypothetical protein [Pseudomonadota bacterium]